MIYPKSLAGRLEMTAETRKDAEAQGPKVYGGEERILNLDDLRQVSHLCLRLEAVAATISSPITTTPLIASPVPDDMSPGGRSIASAHAMKRSNTAQLHALTSTMHLGPKISEEMSNDELLTILLSLSARIENVLSTLVSSPRIPVSLHHELTRNSCILGSQTTGRLPSGALCSRFDDRIKRHECVQHSRSPLSVRGSQERHSFHHLSRLRQRHMDARYSSPHGGTYTPCQAA